jgi:hypothetical protein
MLSALLSSVEETKTVATLTPPDCNWEVETKPEPRTSKAKLLLDVVCVIAPLARTGRGLRTSTLIRAEDTCSETVFAPIRTELPATIVDAGEYMPEVDIRPMALLPPVRPSTDQTTGVATPPTVASYCA